MVGGNVSGSFLKESGDLGHEHEAMYHGTLQCSTRLRFLHLELEVSSLCKVPISLYAGSQVEIFDFENKGSSQQKRPHKTVSRENIFRNHIFQL